MLNRQGYVLYSLVFAYIPSGAVGLGYVVAVVVGPDEFNWDGRGIEDGMILECIVVCVGDDVGGGVDVGGTALTNP